VPAPGRELEAGSHRVLAPGGARRARAGPPRVARPSQRFSAEPFPVLATPASIAATGFGTFVPGLPHPGRPSLVPLMRRAAVAPGTY